MWYVLRYLGFAVCIISSDAFIERTDDLDTWCRRYSKHAQAIMYNPPAMLRVRTVSADYLFASIFATYEATYEAGSAPSPHSSSCFTPLISL